MRNEEVDLPVIGIAMAVYNGEKFLEETLRNVQSQTEQSWECVVVDDGSKDSTPEIVERLAREDGRFRLVRQPNAGPAAARNHGFTSFSPSVRYVTFLDGDDMWVEDGLETLRRELESHPANVAAYGLGETIDEHSNILNEGHWPSYGRRRLAWRKGRLVPLKPHEATGFEALVYFSNIVPPHMLLARREALDKVGTFDPALWVIPDTDLWLRLSRLSDLHFIDRVVALYRRHESNFSHQNPRTKKELAYLITKALASPNNTPEQRKIIQGSYRLWQRDLMVEKFGKARASWRTSPLHSALMIAHIAGHVLRYARGYPTPIS